MFISVCQQKSKIINIMIVHLMAVLFKIVSAHVISLVYCHLINMRLKITEQYILKLILYSKDVFFFGI